MVYARIVLNSIDLKKYKVFSMICYLVMGWCIIVKINILPALLGMTGFWLLLAGGIVYTIGAILYGLGKNHSYIHCDEYLLLQCIVQVLLFQSLHQQYE